MNDQGKEHDALIYSYTRKQAIEDGVLVDVSEWAGPRGMMGGFKIPVAMTAAVWGLMEAPEGSHEDTRGRAHDVLWMARLAAQKNPDIDRASFFAIIGRELIRLVIHVGPGDEGEPVATIMLPGED